MIKTTNLVKRYGDFLALDTLNLEISEGSILGLLGPNGAGKTTFINCLIGMTKYQSGEISIFDKSFKTDERQIKSWLGIVPQNLAVYMDISAYENVKYFGSLYGLKGKELNEAVKKALEFVDLWDRRKEKPKKYSGGMKRRLNIACAVVHSPKIVIMDEPTVGIDPQSRNHILNSVMQLRSNGCTVIYTSHYMEEIEMICDEIAIIDHGKLIASGTQDDLRKFISKDRIVEIEIDNLSFTIIDALKKLNGVKECFQKDRTLTIVIDQSHKNLDRIIYKINESEGKIMSMNMKKASLEDVFLTLTGRTLRD